VIRNRFSKGGVVGAGCSIVGGGGGGSYIQAAASLNPVDSSEACVCPLCPASVTDSANRDTRVSIGKDLRLDTLGLPMDLHIVA